MDSSHVGRRMTDYNDRISVVLVNIICGRSDDNFTFAVCRENGENVFYFNVQDFNYDHVGMISPILIADYKNLVKYEIRFTGRKPLVAQFDLINRQIVFGEFSESRKIDRFVEDDIEHLQRFLADETYWNSLFIKSN
jgi:hypothetical protein